MKRQMKKRKKYPAKRTVAKREGHPAKRTVAKREGYPAKRTVAKREGYPAKRTVAKGKGYPAKRTVAKREGYPAKQAVTKREGYPAKQAVTKREGYPVKRAVAKGKGYPVKRIAVKGKRYKKKKKINKKRVFLVMAIFVAFIVGISRSFKGGKPKEEQVEETIGEIEQEQVEETIGEIEQEPVVIEPSEDAEIKKLIQTEQEKYKLTEENFAFFYYRVNDKKYYFYNQDKTFTAASTIKVPVAMLYYDKINRGEMTLDSTLTYSQGTYEAGGGTTASTYKIGQKIPVSFLLKQSIVNSDNTAVNILIKNIGQKQYRIGIAEYTDEKEKLPAEFYTQNLTTATFAYNIIDHLYQNQSQYTNLIEDMKKSSSGAYLKKYITEYEVAHKYGSYNGYVHDYGFVLSVDPYLIGIFTKNVTNADEVIAEISLDALKETEKIRQEELSENN